MAAARYSFIVEQGATTNIQLKWEDASGSINLSGYSGRMQIRPTVESSTVYLTLSSSLDVDGTGLNMSGSDGETAVQSGSIGIYISATKSAQLNFETAYYDLEMMSGNEVTRLLEGQVKLSKNVTR
jgi:hypothetical protein